MTPVTLRGEGIVIEGFGVGGRSPAHSNKLYKNCFNALLDKSREPSERNLMKKEDERALNKTPSLSENSGPLSNEYRMEGLKRFYGKAAMEEPKPRSSLKNSSNQVQIPGHYFSFVRL